VLVAPPLPGEPPVPGPPPVPVSPPVAVVPPVPVAPPLPVSPPVPDCPQPRSAVIPRSAIVLEIHGPVLTKLRSSSVTDWLAAAVVVTPIWQVPLVTAMPVSDTCVKPVIALVSEASFSLPP
jgi:hypothetical protein